MGTELEWKLTVPEAGLLDEILDLEEIRTRMAETPRCYHMRTTYYDTPSRRFSERHFTVRQRMENDRSVLCVKAPAPGKAPNAKLRSEWEIEGGDISAALPELVAAGAPAELLEAAREGLVAVCGAEFRRRAVLLRFSDGSACELALDAGTLFGPGRSEPLCELELEMKAGAPAATLELYRFLWTRFGLVPQPKSKYARAAGLN